MTLARQKPFPDLLVSIEEKLRSLGWLTIERQGDRRVVTLLEPRVLNWAVAVCIKSGTASDFMDRLLERTPADRRWHAVRVHLPESAFYVLDGKLDAFLLSEDPP